MDSGTTTTVIVISSLHLAVAIFTAYWTFRASQIRPPPPRDEQQVTTADPIDDYYRELARLSKQGLNSIKRMRKDERVDEQVRDLVSIFIPQRIQK